MSDPYTREAKRMLDNHTNNKCVVCNWPLDNNGNCPCCDADVQALLSRIAELEDPDWTTFITLCHAWLEKYPPDIFTGESQDSGPRFVVALRNALKELEKGAK